MAIQGNTLYVTAGAQGIRIFDIVDPNHLTLVLTQSTPFAWDVELFGGIVVVGTDAGIHTFQISAQGGGLTNIENYVYENSFSDFDVWDVKVIGDIAYIAGGNDRLYTLNIKDPNNPVLLDRWSTGNDGFLKLDVDGQFAHCANTTGEFVFDVSNPNNIRYLGMLSGAGMYDVMAIGNFGHVVLDSVYGIGNWTSPTDPAVFKMLSFPANLTSVFVNGRNAFVGEYSGGSDHCIYAIDIINSPKIIDNGGAVMSFVWDLYVDGDMLYVANGKWLHTWNVSFPYNMIFEDYINWGSDYVMKGVHSFGTTLVAAKNFEGVGLINITDVDNIFQIVNYSGIESAMQVEVAGDLAFVANRDSLLIFRLFESIADTYVDETNLVQSKSIFTMPNGSISAATLTFEQFALDGVSITFEMTADGSNWEVVTPNSLHNFTSTGTDLRWRAYLDGDTDRSVHLYQVEIEYEYSYEKPALPWLSPLYIGLIAGGAGLLLLIILVTIIIVAVRKKKKSLPTR
ncbi:MAG: hypothetical protein U9O98_04550 [Asgard group archaeon]|nr:hypothetical protein [Asgard group archaeon]